MPSEDLFSREEALGGMPAQRARTLLFLIESRTGQLVARSRRAMERFLTDEAAEARDLAFLEAFSAGKDPPLRPSVQDLERHAPQWAPLVPENPGLRAAVARLLGEKYTFTYPAVPGLRAALGLDEEPVKRAYQRQYKQALETIYAARPGLFDRLRWAWAGFAGRLEALPPFWTAFALTLTETVGAGILALPIALAGMGPLAGVVLLVVMGLVNLLTIAYMAEAVSRSGEIRYGKAYFGRLVADFLGRDGSFILSVALVLINSLVLVAYFIGLSTTLEDATRVPALFWAALLFLVDLYFLRRRSLNATISAALLVGAINIAVILILALFILPWVRTEYLTYVNVPYLNGRPFDPAILQLAFGVVLAAYFGHTSMGNCAKVVLSRDPSARSLIWGSSAAQIAALGLYSIWLVTVNGAVAPLELAGLSGTALAPLAARVGPVVYVLGLIFVILGMGMASIHFSLGFFNQVQEWLPKQRQPVILLPRRRGRLIFQDQTGDNRDLRFDLVYLGLAGGQPRFRLNVQNDSEVHSLDIAANSQLDGAALLQHMPHDRHRDIRWLAEIQEAGADSVRLSIKTPLALSYAGEWDTSGMGISELLSLPADQRQILDFLMRKGEASLVELAAHSGQTERAVRPAVEALAAQGFVSSWVTPVGTRYRAQLAAKKGRALPQEIWAALGELGEDAPDPLQPEPGLRGRWQAVAQAWMGERGRFLLGIGPLVLVFLATEWLLFTDSESFSRPLSFLGVIVVSLMGGVFPALLLVAGRLKGEYVPEVVYRFLGHPALTWGVYLLSVGALFLHGLVLWRNPIERAIALGVGLLMLGLTITMARRRVFAPRMIVELRQDQARSAGQAVFAVTRAGQGLAAEVQLEYPGGWQELRAPGGEIAEFQNLRQAIFILPAGQAHDLKVWAHTITPEGDSEGLPARLEFQSGEDVKRFDLNLSRGQALIPLNGGQKNGSYLVRLVFGSEVTD
jgi:amino acid permease